MKLTQKKKEMYMANVLVFHVGGNANFSVFRYQHVGIPNAKFRVGGLSQREDTTQVFLRCSGI